MTMRDEWESAPFRINLGDGDNISPARLDFFRLSIYTTTQILFHQCIICEAQGCDALSTEGQQEVEISEVSCCGRCEANKGQVGGCA